MIQAIKIDDTFLYIVRNGNCWYRFNSHKDTIAEIEELFDE